MSLVLDTHAAIWYLAGSRHLSNAAFKRIERAIAQGQPVYISAISIIEIIYLVERGRVARRSLENLITAIKNPVSGLVIADVDSEISEAVEKVSRQAVPDMPDRIIAATAFHLGLPLVTRDARIQTAGVTSIW